MTDNFDSNVAKRMPRVTNKKRPIHPWDVDSFPGNDISESDSLTSEHKPTLLTSILRPLRAIYLFQDRRLLMARFLLHGKVCSDMVDICLTVHQRK